MMDRQLVPGVEVDHAGRRWRVHRALGPDAVLLTDDAGEIVSAAPARVELATEIAITQPPRAPDERLYTDAQWAEAVTGVSLGCFATKDIAAVFRRDEQLANRFEVLTLPRWQLEDMDYAKLLATFAQLLPLRRPSPLTDPDLAQTILAAAGGLIGGIASLLRQAAVEAIRTGHECIDRPMLARAHGSLPERIEAVANAANL